MATHVAPRHHRWSPRVDAAVKNESQRCFPHCRDKSIMRSSSSVTHDWRSRRSGRSNNYSARTCTPSHFLYGIRRSNFPSRFELTMLLTRGSRITPRDRGCRVTMLGIFRGVGDSNFLQNRIIFCHGCVYFGVRLFEQGKAMAAHVAPRHHPAFLSTPSASAVCRADQKSPHGWYYSFDHKTQSFRRPPTPP